METHETSLREALKLALSALPDSETAGPNGTGYRWANDLVGDEREWLEMIRKRVSELLEACR